MSATKRTQPTQIRHKEGNFHGLIILQHVPFPHGTDLTRHVQQAKIAVGYSAPTLAVTGLMLGYFRLVPIKRFYSDLDKWVRRRIRMCIWTSWKNGRTRVANLLKLGIREHEAYTHV